MKNTGRIFEDKLPQGKSANAINKNLGNMRLARTEENVITVDEMVGLLNHKKTRNKHVHQYARHLKK